MEATCASESSLEFEDQMFVELLSDDGLVVIAKYVPSNFILCNIIIIYTRTVYLRLVDHMLTSKLLLCTSMCVIKLGLWRRYMLCGTPSHALSDLYHFYTPAGGQSPPAGVS